MSDMLSIAQSGVRAYARALDVVADNVANAGTPGHVRRTANLTPAATASSPGPLELDPVGGNGVRLIDHWQAVTGGPSSGSPASLSWTLSGSASGYGTIELVRLSHAATVTGSVSLSGNGTLTGAGVRKVLGSASLSGNGTAADEKLLRPRWSWLVGPRAEHVLGALTLVLAVVITLPIPFGNMLPAFAICLIALGVLERDGLWACFGILVGALALLLSATVAYAMLKGALFVLLGAFS